MPSKPEKQPLQQSKARSKITVMSKVGNTGNCSRSANDTTRGRKQLHAYEIETTCKAIRSGSRYPLRDELAVRMAYHHGLRASELVGLQWQHIDLKARQVQVNRKKNGISNTHPIVSRKEITLLNKLHREQGKPKTGYVFNTERGTVLSVKGLGAMFSAYSEKALGIKWNFHALRHATATDLIDQNIHIHTIQHFMGHRNLQNTTVYLSENSSRFRAIDFD